MALAEDISIQLSIDCHVVMSGHSYVESEEKRSTRKCIGAKSSVQGDKKFKKPVAK